MGNGENSRFRSVSGRVESTIVMTPEFDDVYHEAESYFIDGYLLIDEIAREQAEEDVVPIYDPIDPLQTTRQSIYIDIHTILARLHGHELTLPLAVESRTHHLVAEQLNVLNDAGERHEVFVDVCRGIARRAMRAALDASGAFSQYDDSFDAQSAMHMLINAYAEKLLERHELA